MNTMREATIEGKKTGALRILMKFIQVMNLFTYFFSVELGFIYRSIGPWFLGFDRGKEVLVIFFF